MKMKKNKKVTPVPLSYHIFSSASTLKVFKNASALALAL